MTQLALGPFPGSPSLSLWASVSSSAVGLLWSLIRWLGSHKLLLGDTWHNAQQMSPPLGVRQRESQDPSEGLHLVPCRNGKKGFLLGQSLSGSARGCPLARGQQGGQGLGGQLFSKTPWGQHPSPTGQSGGNSAHWGLGAVSDPDPARRRP